MHGVSKWGHRSHSQQSGNPRCLSLSCCFYQPVAWYGPLLPPQRYKFYSPFCCDFKMLVDGQGSHLIRLTRYLIHFFIRNLLFFYYRLFVFGFVFVVVVVVIVVVVVVVVFNTTFGQNGTSRNIC